MGTITTRDVRRLRPSSAFLLTSAGVSGTLILLSFPPFGQSWLMWFALTPLFAIHRRLTRSALFAYGYLLALVPIGAIAFCILPSSALAFVVFAACVPACFAGGIVVATSLEQRFADSWRRVLVFPLCAVLVELALGNEWIRVPATLALTQSAAPIVIQNADIFGTSGTTFLLLLINRCWPMIWTVLVRRPRPDAFEWKKFAGAMAGIGLLTVDVAYGSWALRYYERGDATIPIATVQPMITTNTYVRRLLDADAQATIDASVEGLTERALASKPALVVIPEGGNGRYNFRIPSLRHQLQETARRSGAGLLVSSPDMTMGGEQYNALFSLAADGTLLGAYRKRMLTPVGERHLSRGLTAAPLASSAGLVGAMLCFESCFPDIARSLVAQGARYLLVSSSDASFRNSALGLLHSRFSVFRAIETRRYLIQANNTGPSMVISPTGVIVAATSFLDPGVLTGRVGVRNDETLFTRIGAFGAVALCAIAAVVLAMPINRRRVVSPVDPIRTTISPVCAPRPASGVRSAFTALGYCSLIALLACASVHLASRGTGNDHGPLQNLNTFLASTPPPDVRRAGASHLQHARNTCGPAALAFVLTLYGVDVKESDISSRVRLEDRGTTMRDLVHAAEQLGFTAGGLRMNFTALGHEPTPTIAYLRNTDESGHFVVVLLVEDPWVYLFDPANGLVKMRTFDFVSVWNGYALQVRFPYDPEIDGLFTALGGSVEAARASASEPSFRHAPIAAALGGAYGGRAGTLAPGRSRPDFVSEDRQL